MSMSCVQSNDINIYIYNKSGKAHDKNLIIDDKHVTTGSFNFTENAEHKNAENLLYIKNDPALAQKFKNRFIKTVIQGKTKRGKKIFILVEDYDQQKKQHLNQA